jgi:hypothetical protein
MLSEVLSASFELAIRGWLWLNEYPVLKVVAVILVLLVVWRLWRFTVLPAYFPDDPKELPYWIPCEYLPFHNALQQILTMA